MYATMHAVSACCLCLLQLLGRSDNLSDYVRTNCRKAWVEITLSGGEGRKDRDIVIRRYVTAHTHITHTHTHTGHTQTREALTAQCYQHHAHKCMYLKCCITKERENVCVCVCVSQRH